MGSSRNYTILGIIILILLLPMALNNSAETIAVQHCGEKDVEKVYRCGDMVQVVSSLPVAGSIYYRSDGSEVRCPATSTESMSPDCKRILEMKTSSLVQCEKIC